MVKPPRSYSITRVVIVALILALPGCAFTRMLTARFEKPTFTFAGSELIEASQRRAVVNFLFTAHNPNKAGLKNITCSYELSAEGKKFLTENDIPLALGPQGDTEVKIPATIVYADLFPVLGSVVRRILSGPKTLPITINAVFSGKPAIYGEPGKEQELPFEMSVTRTVDLPLMQERGSRGQ